MGGTFNPIHNGHLILAESAYEQFHLDKIIFLPSGNPPHKPNVSYIEAKHRCNMVDIAIYDNFHFEIFLNFYWYIYVFLIDDYIKSFQVEL